MIDIYFKPCCQHCNNLDLDYEQTNGMGEQVTVIGCRHSCVCWKYQEDPDEETLSPQDVTVRGFCRADG